MGTHVERLGKWLLGAAILWGTVSVTEVYVAYWPRVMHLPAQVVALDRAHGSRPVPLSQMSPWLPKALIATEDRTFYTNLGISVRGILRALWVDVTTGHLAEGGSTLTQQLVRDRLLGLERTFRRKIQEALLAMLVTAVYSKQDILTMYLNQVYLGQGAYGVWAAAHVYFGRDPARLTLAESALLAGLPQAPSALDPLVHYARARRREWEVLQSMVDTGVISRARAMKAFEAPLGLVR
jgi:membrane peptidoglycan carboxypeptidase